MKRFNRSLAVWLVAAALAGFITACGGGGGGGDSADDKAASSEWNEMKWDEGRWQ
ncbi:MAG: hypothetical protein ACQES2_08335 [Pseudomonadota bacterium]